MAYALTVGPLSPANLMKESAANDEEKQKPAPSGNTDGGTVKESEENSPGETQEGSIYKVPGEATTNGKAYIGRHNQPTPQETRKSDDGRDRTKAKVIDKYDAKNVTEGRIKEQKAINKEGGVENLDNKRNEIAHHKWIDSSKGEEF